MLRCADWWRHSCNRIFPQDDEQQLTQKFLPIVTKVTSKVGLADKCDTLRGRDPQLGLVDVKEARLRIVTQNPLDGLLVMIAEQEKAIRTDPGGAASGMTQKVFGMLVQ